jgi:hypothetical protein
LVVNLTDAPNHGATVRTGTNMVSANTSACGTAPPQANAPASSKRLHTITRRIAFLLELQFVDNPYSLRAFVLLQSCYPSVRELLCDEQATIALLWRHGD